jgi:NADH-ubiquinone oxidoreductase chain 5
MLFSILFIFFLNFLIIILFNQFLNNIMVIIISIIFLIYGLYWSFILLKIFLIDSNIIYILDLGVWLEFDNLQIKWEFLFDSMNIFMIITVMIISSLVHIYSFDYMKNDPHFGRFISYLSLFTFFMLILLTANNFIIMFIGWEGVGLCSYLLINFWYTRIQANKAAIKAMIINKIGDFGMLVGMLLIFNNFKHLTIILYFYQIFLII